MSASALTPYLMSALNTVDPDVLLKIALERKGAGRMAAVSAPSAYPPAPPPQNPWAQNSMYNPALMRAEYEMFGPDAERGSAPERIDPTGSFSPAAFSGQMVPEQNYEPKQVEPHLLARFEALQSQIGTLKAQIEVLVNRDRDKDDRINECLSILRAMQNTHGMMGA